MTILINKEKIFWQSKFKETSIFIDYMMFLFVNINNIYINVLFKKESDQKRNIALTQLVSSEADLAAVPWDTV